MRSRTWLSRRHGLLGAGVGQLADQRRGPEELVLPQVTDRLDVERVLEVLRVAVADPGQRADGCLEELGQGLALVLLVQQGVEVHLNGHVGLRSLRMWFAESLPR